MRRAFVVQLSADCLPGKTFIGRAEHVRSGRAIHFTGMKEFVEFLALSLETEKHAEAQESLEDNPSEW